MTNALFIVGFFGCVSSLQFFRSVQFGFTVTTSTPWLGMGAINCGSPERTRSLLPHLSSSHTFIDLFAYCLMGTTCLRPAQQHAVLTNYLVAHYKGALVYIIFNKHDFSLLTSKLLKLIYVHLCWQTSFSVKSAKNSGEPFLFLLYKVHPNYIGFEFFLSSTNCSLEKFKEIKKNSVAFFMKNVST